MVWVSVNCVGCDAAVLLRHHHGTHACVCARVWDMHGFLVVHYLPYTSHSSTSTGFMKCILLPAVPIPISLYVCACICVCVCACDWQSLPYMENESPQLGPEYCH